MAPSLTNRFVPKHGNYQLFLKQIEPKEKSSSRYVYVVPGLYDYHESYLPFLCHWQEVSTENLGFIIIDLPGHGFSEGPRGHMEDYGQILKDLRDIMLDNELTRGQQIQSKHVFAHDLGAVFALSLMLKHEQHLRHEINSFILSNPFLFPQLDFFPGALKFELFHSVLEKVMVPRPKNYSSKLSECNDRKYTFEANNLILSKLSQGFWQEAKTMIDYVKSRSYLIETPTCFLLSESSPFTDSALSELFYKGLGAEKKQIIFLPTKTHESFSGDLNNFYSLVEHSDLWIQTS